MNKTKLDNVIKTDNIIIPLYILKLYKNFNVTLEEFVFLMYLYNKNGFIFNPEKICNDLNIELTDVMILVSNLGDKGLLNLDVSKEEGLKVSETINLSGFYDKISLSLMSELNIKEESDETIYSLIEQEFNRKLTPMECEVIKEWENSNYSFELMKKALKEASINGVSNLRYIDKILYDWDKRGIKTVSDIEKNKIIEQKDEIEIYNCNWLDEDE